MAAPIGKMDRRIMIQSLSVSLDGAGQPVETWADVEEVWAQVTPQPGGEGFRSRQIMGRAVTVFKIRYRSGVTAQHRVVYGGQNYDIHDVREIGRREMLEIDTSARVG